VMKERKSNDGKGGDPSFSYLHFKQNTLHA